MAAWCDFCVGDDRQVAQICKQCNNACYCKRHSYLRPIHELMCADFANFTRSRRPSNQHFQALLFSANKTKPEFVWMQCTVLPGSNGQSNHVFPMIPEHLTPNDPHSSPPMQYYPLVNGKCDPIYVCYLTTSTAKKNRSVTHVAATIGIENTWNASLIAFGCRDLLYGALPRDLDMNDYLHVATFLLVHEPKHHRATLLDFLRHKISLSLAIVFGISASVLFVIFVFVRWW